MELGDNAPGSIRPLTGSPFEARDGRVPRPGWHCSPAPLCRRQPLESRSNGSRHGYTPPRPRMTPLTSAPARAGACQAEPDTGAWELLSFGAVQLIESAMGSGPVEGALPRSRPRSRPDRPVAVSKWRASRGHLCRAGRQSPRTRAVHCAALVSASPFAAPQPRKQPLRCLAGAETGSRQWRSRHPAHRPVGHSPQPTLLAKRQFATRGSMQATSPPHLVPALRLSREWGPPHFSTYQTYAVWLTAHRPGPSLPRSPAVSLQVFPRFRVAPPSS